MISIKINMKIIILSIIITIFMYPFTTSYLFNIMRDVSIAKKLSSSTVQNIKTTVDRDKTKVVFMFDDGWESVYTEAYELMNEFDYKGSLAVIPSLVGEAGYMSYEQLSELYLQGWELLNHTYYHKENAYEDSLKLLSDFNKARKWMTNRYIGDFSNMAVIPYGEVNPYIIDMLKGDGYRNVRTSDNIIILDRNEIEYYPVATINLLTNIPEYEVERLLAQSFTEPKTFLLIMHKIGNVDDGFGMTYSRDKFEHIITFINENSDKFQVITYSQIFA